MHDVINILAASDASGAAAGFGLIWILTVLVSLVAFAFWLWMLVDCLTSPMETGEKLIWVLVMIFLPVIGSIIYYFVKHGGPTMTPMAH